VALDDVPRLDLVREDDFLLACGATRAPDQGSPPLLALSAQPERDPRSRGAVNDVARLGARRHLQGQAALRAGNGRANHLVPLRPWHFSDPPQIPRRRWSFPRSKPTTTSLSTRMTGVAIFPESRITSCRAAASCAISMLV